jgi:hypothetical protein
MGSSMQNCGDTVSARSPQGISTGTPGVRFSLAPFLSAVICATRDCEEIDRLADDDTSSEPTTTTAADGDETVVSRGVGITEGIETAAAPSASEPESAHAWSLDHDCEEADAEGKWPGRFLWAGVVALLCATVAAVVWFSTVFYFQGRLTPTPTARPASPLPSPTALFSPTPLPIIRTAMTSAPPANCGVNLDADQVRTAMEVFEQGNPGFAPGGVNQSGGNFDPCVTLSMALVYPYGASSGAPQMALMFHKGQYVGPATAAAYAYMRFNAEQTTDTTVVLDFAESAGSCSACPDKGYESIRFRWQTDHIEMVGIPPSYGRLGP